MKNKIAVMTVLTLIGICGFFGFAYLKYVNASSDIGFEVKTAKNVYSVGEIVPVTVFISNKSSETLFLPGNLIEHLKIQISEDGSEYKTYEGVGAGIRIDGLLPEMKVHPGKSLIMPSSIFWNAKPEVSHLNANAARQVTKGKILSDYVFSKPGTYFVKASLNIPGENELKIDSAPVQITITAPEGEDLAVWNKIRERGDIGYFLQAGDFKTPDAEARENLRREVEEIAYLYPTSSISRQIGRGLERFQSNQAKRKAVQEQLKQPE